MLKVERSTDYLKGVNSEIVDLLKEEQRIEQQAWKRKYILNRLKRSNDYDQKHSWQTLEDETAKVNYDYWLQKHDIAHIARTSYQYDHGYDEQGRQTQSETIFEICDLNTLNNQLGQFKGYVVNGETRPLTLIINLSAGHWVTLIVQHKLGHYYAYYSNSLGDKIQDNVESALRNKISANVKIFDLKIKQQVDGNNCGIFSLLNANKINELLKDNKPLDEVYRAIREIENSSDFLVGMRRSFSEELKKDSERLKTNIRDFALGHNIDIREISDSDINQPSQSNLKNSQELDQLFRKAIDKGYISIAAFAVKIGVSNDVIQNLSNDEKENFKKYMEKHDQQFSRDHQEIINLLKVEERSASSRQQSSSTLGQQKNREKPVDPAKSDRGPSESRIERSDSQTQPGSSNANQGNQLDNTQPVSRQQSPGLSSDYDDEITPEEELINTIKSNDSEEEKLAKIKRLFEKEPKPDINFQVKDSDTSLHIAIRKGELKVIKLLVQKGAKVNDDSVRNKRNRTPLDTAKHLKRQDIVEILEPNTQSNLQASAQQPSTQHKRTRTNSEEVESEDSNPKKQKTSSTDVQPMGVDQDTSSRKRSHEDEENALQGKRPKLSTYSNSQQSSDIQENRKPTGLLASYHGVAYQVQWMMVVALEAQERLNGKKSGAFKFRTVSFKTEDPDAGKFDDLVWRYETDKSGLYEYNFLQAKHKLDKEEKITFKELLKPKQKKDSLKSNKKDKRPFALEKYFLSYRDEIKKKYSEDGKINKLIIVTNIDFDNDLKSSFDQLQDNIPILDLIKKETGQKPENWKFREGNVLQEIKEQLKGTYDLIKIARDLGKCVLENETIKKDGTLNSYLSALEQNRVIESSGKFHSYFTEEDHQNLPKKAKQLRIAFFQEAFTNKRKSLGLSIDYKISYPEKLAEQIASKIIKSFNKLKKEVTISKTEKVLESCIDDLAGYVLIEKDGGILFNPNFWALEDNKLPSDSLRTFRNKLKSQLESKIKNSKGDRLKNFKEKGLNAFINEFKEYQFNIGSKGAFRTCKEILADKDAFWKNVKDFKFDQFDRSNLDQSSSELPSHELKDIEEDINRFFGQLVFVVNYPQETLDEFIKKKCAWFVGFETDYVAYEFQARIANALNLKVKEFISTPEKVDNFFEEAKDKLNSLVLIGPTLLYKAQIKEYGIEFQESCIKELFEYTDNEDNQKSYKFLNSDKNVLSLVTEQNDLTAIKVYQAIGQYQEEDKCIFMSLSSILLIKEHVLSAFEKCDLLIIECDDYTNKDVQGLYSSLKSKLNGNKKIILITKENDLLANKFKPALRDKYQEKIDEKNSLTDLTPESQVKLLERGKVTFQGEKGVSLGTLVDDASKHLIDGEVLSKLINHEKIKIGKALIDSKYEDIKDYYIPRTFNRQVKIKEVLKEKESEFLVTDSNQFDKSELQKDQDIVLISDTDEVFKDLCDKHKKHNIHWLKEEQDDLIWQKSYGASLSKLREFVDTSAQTIQEYTTEKITDIEDRAVIISAEPGMGKSTVLNPLALEEKKTDPSLWIVRVNLNDHTSKLKTANLKDKAIEFLSDIGLETSLEKELFKHRINVQGKIALLFDGFDEISPKYEEKVIELLQVLKNTKVEKLWITTRPYKVVQEKLEDKLSVFSYLLKPLLPEEQKDLLRKFWKAQLKLNELDEQRSGVFIDELLDNLPKSIDDKDFMSIPLHASMVAEVFQDNFGEFYNSNQDKPSLLKKLDLIDLYKEFIDKKYIIYCREKKKQDMTNVAVEEDNTNLSEIFTRNHQKAALYALFEEGNLKDLLSDNEYREVNVFITKIKDGKEKTGIIYHDGKLKFVHRTFAEYFVASYFWESFKSVQSNKFEDFVESTIVKNLIEDDRIQISKFLQLKAKKDFESNIDFPDKQNKLRTLLTKLLDQTTQYDYNGNGKKSTKLLFGIVEFSFSTKEKSNVDVIENNDQLKLLCVSAEMGYIKLVNVLEKKLNKEFLQKYLKFDKWFYSPLWLAAQNAHLDVLEVLVKKFSYDPNWKDKDSNTLVERIFQRTDEFDVLRSCLKLDIVDGKPYEDLNHRQALPIVEVFNNVAPSDVIKLLIEKTDSNLVNGFIKYPESSSQISPAQLIAVQSLKYGKEITELAIKKGIDFSDVTNLLLYEYCYESLNSPINKLIYARYSQPSFHSDKEFLNLFERIELLLKAGVGYNHKDIQHSKTTLQYAEQIHYIHKLLDGVHKLHNQKINKSSNPLGTILKLIIDNVGSSPDFEGYEFVVSQKEQKISLSLNYKDKSYKYNKGIPLLPNNIPKLLFKFYEDSNTNLVESTLDKFRNYITNAKEEIEEFKQYRDRKIYNEILIGYAEMLEVNDYDFVSPHFYHQFYLRSTRKEKEERYKSLDEYEKDLLKRVLNLYIRQDYKINDALKEVVEEVLRFKEIINKLKENSDDKKYKTEEILDILAIKSLDTNEELQDLISKIYECGGIEFLSETWSSLNSIGQQRIMGILELMFKFADQSSKIFELLKKLDDPYKTLTKAIENKDYQKINNILQDIEPDFIKAIINGQDDEYGSPLHYAASEGDEKATTILLERRANPNLKMQGNDVLLSTAEQHLKHDYQGCTPLHVAVFNGQLEVAEILVKYGADVNAMSTGWQVGTPLHMAVQSGKLDVIDFLVAKGADVNAMSTGWQGTPLHMAVQSGKLDVVNFLVAKGADVNVATEDGLTPALNLAHQAKWDIVKYLLEKGANINASAKSYGTLLHIAARQYRFDEVKFLIEKGAHYDVKNTQGKTPLNLAQSDPHIENLLSNIDKLFKDVRAGETGKVDSLLQGKDYDTLKVIINARNTDSNTPLHYAAPKGYSEIVRSLSEKGGNPDTQNKDGGTPLHYAALNGRLDIVKYLIDNKKADFKITDNDGSTPLHYAASNGHLDIVKYLIDNKKADFKITNNYGSTPLHYAASNGHLKSVKLLLEKGAHYDVKNTKGKTPLNLVKSGSVKNLLSDIDKLFKAVQDGKKDEVDSLLKGEDSNTLKAVLNARNTDGKTLIDVAGNTDIEELLKEKLRISDQQQQTVQQGGRVSAEECLPSTSSGRSKREASGEKCLFTWEDVDEFNEEKDERRDVSKINIDGEKFVSYIKDLPKEKQSQLIQLASEVKIGGSSQGLVSKLIGNQKVMNHLGRVGKISGMTMHGMMAKNVLADFLNGDYQGVATNVRFIVGGQLAAIAAKYASLTGLKLAEEGKLLVGNSLKAASPFLARGTSAFVVYDLVNQIKAFKNGTEEALVGVVGDSIYLGVDAAEIGVEVAEGFGVLEGVSSVTGPIGATIGAVVFVGTDIYMAVKRVDKIDQIIHLTGNEKFIEGLRAFIGIKPEQYIEELMEKKQLYNQLVKQGLEYLKQHSDIQSYVFPTGKSVVDSCRKVPEEVNTYAIAGFTGAHLTFTRYTEKCTTKFEEDLDSKVLLDRKRTGIRWSRARPDDLSDAKLFCLPQGNDEAAPDYGSYLCENAIGIFANKTGDHTLINLGEGKDYAKGFLNSPNIFVVNNGSKEYYGGSKDDIFVLHGNYIKGHLSGEGGINTLDTTLFALQEEQLNIQLEIGEIADYFRDNWLKICEINKVIGRANKAETITVSCDGCNSNVKLIDGQSGNKEIKDRINIIDDSCDYQMQIVVRPNTVVYNRALKGSFDYLVPLNSSGSAELSFIYGPERFNVNNTFWFAYQAVDIKSIDVKYINVFNRTEHEVKFNFVESNKEFNVTISYSENPAYRLGKSGEIRIGNKGNLYMLESSDKSSEEVIRDYLPVANRVSKMSFFIQSVLSNETVVIGSGNHEVIHSNPAYRSHLVGNGGENVYVIDSETKEVIIHDVDEENSIDTIDLRNVVKKGNHELKVIRFENDLLLRATVKEQAEYCTVRLKDGVERYNKTHVIVENVPMRISFDNNQWSLKPQPLMFERDKEIIVVTNQDIEQGSEIITPRKGGNYKFVRSNDNDLIITNSFDSTIAKNDLCTITLSKFYETPRMKTLFIKFADKEIILKEHQEEISTARDVNVVKKEHKDQVYNDVFNPEVMMLSDQPVTHRHSRHREQARHRRSTTSSSTRPTGWINDLFGWVKSSVSGLLSSKPESTKSPISQVDARVDVNGTIMLLDVLVRKFTGKQYIFAVDQSIPLLEARSYALNITNRFEELLNKTAIKSGISLTNLNFDPLAVQSAIIGKIINGKFSEIAKTLYSFAKEACPEFKQTDKFLVHLRSQLEGEKGTVLLQQKVEKPYKDLSQEVSRKVELSKKPDTFLNGTSVVKGISRGIN